MLLLMNPAPVPAIPDFCKFTCSFRTVLPEPCTTCQSISSSTLHNTPFAEFVGRYIAQSCVPGCQSTRGLQAHSGQPRYMTALTAVLLQAAIADPDLVRAHLADHHCWPALLALCMCLPSSCATQHAQRLSQLSARNSLSAFGSSSFGPASTKPESGPDCISTGTACNADMASEPCGEDDAAQQQLAYDPDKAVDSAGSPSQQRDQSLRTQHMQHTAGAVSHVAQLIICLVQSQPECDIPPGIYAGTDSLRALLHCYALYADTASRSLSAPVWPAQVQAQQQQHAMLEHVAQAGDCVLLV